MFSLTKRIIGPAMLGLAALVLYVPKSHGQNPFFQVRPGLTLQQAAYNQIALGQVLQSMSPYGNGINPYSRTILNTTANGFASPYSSLSSSPISATYGSLYAGGYGSPYGAGYGSAPGTGYSTPPGGGYGDYWPDPISASIAATSKVIKEQGSFMVEQQQAFKLYEQVRADRIQNRRKAFDEYLYEREKTPTPEAERQRSMKEQLIRSRENPPITEVYSAAALNILLADLRAGQDKLNSAALHGEELSLDESDLRHINVIRGVGNPGLLKNDGRLTWPLALSDSDFKEERELVDSFAQMAVGQVVMNGRVDTGTIRQLSTHTELIKQQLRRTGADLKPSIYIEARTFLNSLEDATKALQQPDAAKLFSAQYVLKARTVPELVKFMTDNGLRFAAAVPGDLGAYEALYHALATSDRAIQVQMAARASR